MLKARSLSTDFRYLSLAHFIDQGRPASEVTRAKNVLAFTVNSLSRRGNIIAMVPIDAQGSIFRIRLSDLGWSAALWDQLTSFYPYCLASQVAGHQSLYAQLGTEAPFVRADWLLDTATQAPLYDLLINLPATLNALAAQLGVNIANDINHPGLAEPDNLVRFAVEPSGVSLHNRMAERHLGTAGQYLWVSYDFKTGVGKEDVFANPLGPAAVDKQGFVHTFSNDAGEVIFTMPNGMQGYMLVNGAGQKISVADTAIVRDIRRRDGVVANGISCFGCHAPDGMIRPVSTNQMQNFIQGHVADFSNKEFNEISALYPAVLSPDVLTSDSARYRGAANALDGGGPERGALQYLPFVGFVSDYESNLGFRGAAAEFNQDPAHLQSHGARQRRRQSDPAERPQGSSDLSRRLRLRLAGSGGQDRGETVLRQDVQRGRRQGALPMKRRVGSMLVATVIGLGAVRLRGTAAIRPVRRNPVAGGSGAASAPSRRAGARRRNRRRRCRAASCPAGFDVLTSVFKDKCSGCHGAAAPTKNLDLVTAGVGARTVGAISTCNNKPLDLDDAGRRAADGPPARQAGWAGRRMRRADAGRRDAADRARRWRA